MLSGKQMRGGERRGNAASAEGTGRGGGQRGVAEGRSRPPGREPLARNRCVYRRRGSALPRPRWQPPDLPAQTITWAMANDLFFTNADLYVVHCGSEKAFRAAGGGRANRRSLGLFVCKTSPCVSGRTESLGPTTGPVRKNRYGEPKPFMTAGRPIHPAVSWRPGPG